MKNIKKIMLSVVSVICVFCSVFLVACGQKEESVTTDTGTTNSAKTLSVTAFKNRINICKALAGESEDLSVNLTVDQIKYSTVIKELGGDGRFVFSGNNFANTVSDSSSDTSRQVTLNSSDFIEVSGREQYKYDENGQQIAYSAIEAFLYEDIAHRLYEQYDYILNGLNDIGGNLNEIFNETTPVVYKGISNEGQVDGYIKVSFFAIENGLSLKYILFDGDMNMMQGCMYTALFDGEESVDQIICSAFVDKSDYSVSVDNETVESELIYNYGIYDVESDKNYSLSNSGKETIMPKIISEFNDFANSQARQVEIHQA